MQNTRNKELVSSYLKMHTTLSNAFKETEAVNGMYVKKMDEVTFKEYFESHLKKLATCEDYDICLTDGSKFNYGTFTEGCPTGTCMELTIDTNGNKFPNRSGKDIFTMLVTDRGIKALGESNMCETGLDCGAYILANHKLYDGSVEEATPPSQQLSPEEIAYNNCMADEFQQICTKADGTKDYKTFEACKGDGATTCTTASGVSTKKIGEYYVAPSVGYGDFSNAETTCTSKGMRLPTLAEAQEMYKDAQTTSLAESYDIWVSDKGNSEDSGVIYGIRNDYTWGNTANKNASLTDKAGVWCVAD